MLRWKERKFFWVSAVALPLRIPKNYEKARGTLLKPVDWILAPWRLFFDKFDLRNYDYRHNFDLGRGKEMNLRLSGFAKYCWAVLAYVLFVILFGAFVRATGSGAGCGAHWPLCNGEVIPRPQQIETYIELTHRVTSGLSIPLIIGLLIAAWRKFPAGSPLRVTSALAMVFIVTESLVGAGLVLFELVADNDSVARAIWMMAHLLNTFLLVASITLTAWWATVGRPERSRVDMLTRGLLIAGCAGILLLGMSGAVTALGDTLYPSASLSEGIADDFSPTAHWLIQLRVLHPGIAAGVGIFLFLATGWIRRRFDHPRVAAATNALFGLYAAQLVLGIINVALLAPVWMQLVHLLAANLVWIAFILLSAIVLGTAVAPADSLARGGDHAVHDRVHQAEEVGKLEI
jgi:heme A synthase